MLGQYHQRITELAQCFEAIIVIKETWLVGFHSQLHSNNHDKYTDEEWLAINQTALNEMSLAT